MTETGAHLNLVLNESGDVPLILKSWWSGTVNRNPPDLLDVGRAKPRLAALCILFLLVKYREDQNSFPPQTSSPDGSLIFQADIPKGTWICTLANGREELTEWIKKKFSVSEVFLFASRGAVHNKFGKAYPSIEFKPGRFPLANLHLSVRSQKEPPAKSRPLQRDELIPLARKIEAKYWKEYAIDDLISDRLENKSKIPTTQMAVSAADSLKLPQANAEIPQVITGVDAAQWKAHLALVGGMLMKQEMEKYREKCQPFFTYIGRELNSSEPPFLSQKREWNIFQTSLLQVNCIPYAKAVCDAVAKLCDTGGHFRDERFTYPIWGDIRDKAVLSVACAKIFDRLTPSEVYTNDFMAMQSPPAPPLPELAEVGRLLVWGLENSNRAIATGIFFAHQIVWIDFLAEITWPLYKPSTCRESVFVSDLPGNIIELKEEAIKNGNLFEKFCDSQKDFTDAVQAASLLLKAQSDLWCALHREVIMAGSKGLTASEGRKRFPSIGGCIEPYFDHDD